MGDVTKQSTASEIPDDVLMEILLKLPVKSLFLFRSVSKHWLSFIQNPNFIHLHTNRPINNLNDHYHQPLLILRNLVLRLTSTLLLTFISDDETLAYKYDVPLGLVSPSIVSRCKRSWEKFHLLGPCNGLFCLSDSVDVVIFNPATKQTRKVPPSTLSPRTRDPYSIYGYACFNCVGFGFDSICYDYKVVWFEEINPRDFYDVYDHDFKVEIFSLSTNCWRELKCVVRACNKFCIHSCGMFFNGAFHWVGGDEYDIHLILVFDLDKEDFKHFKLPDRWNEGGEELGVKLSVLNESLAVIVYDEFEYYSDPFFNIWVMTEYGLNTSWRKLYNFDVVEGIKRPLSFHNKDEFLLENADGQLVSFNLNTRETKKFQVHGVPGSMNAFRYRESLVSLN